MVKFGNTPARTIGKRSWWTDAGPGEGGGVEQPLWAATGGQVGGLQRSNQKKRESETPAYTVISRCNKKKGKR